MRLQHVPIRVDLCGVNTENLLCNPDDHRERFVDLKVCDVIKLEASPLECSRNGVGGSLGEVDRVDTSIGICYEEVNIRRLCD